MNVLSCLEAARNRRHCNDSTAMTAWQQDHTFIRRKDSCLNTHDRAARFPDCTMLSKILLLLAMTGTPAATGALLLQVLYRCMNAATADVGRQAT